MNAQIALVALFTFVIHLISTLSLSVRIVGLRTSRWAVSFALFNVMVLVSRLANTFQAPLLARTVETNISVGHYNELGTFRWIIGFATLATMTGALLFPSFQRLMSKAVERYYHHRSFPKLLLNSLSYTTVRQIPAHLKWPDRANWRQLTVERNVPAQMLVLNVLSNGILTVGVLASLYAGYLNPDLRATAVSMAGVINGIATILLVIFIDPDIALLCDEVVEKRHSEGYFRRYISLILLARLAGTVLAQFLLVPFAHLILWVAENLQI